ncbi:carbamoyltransferase [Roseivirga pacifica]|uniref:carbamoyltransferase family protein n=1 Tax=Roseivirga pacifica TaxID=1267423 RepID=UPI003BAE7AA1
MKKDVYVLGTGLSHNGSAVILKNGKIAIGIEKERISRIKHDGGNDSLAVQYCLNALNITLADIDLVVQCENFCTPPQDQFSGKRLFEDYPEPQFHTISHHLAHAYSAVGMSPFKAFNVLVMDGCGSPYEQCIEPDKPLLTDIHLADEVGMVCEKDSFYHYDGKTLKTIFKDFSPMESITHTGYQLPTTRHSIGGFYAAVSNYCFGNMDDVGKLMGLAPYGRKSKIDFNPFELKDGRVFLKGDWYSPLITPNNSWDGLKSNFGHYAEVAFWAQQQVEIAVAYTVNHRQSLSPNFPLCYSGGVALNAVANGKLVQQGLVKSLFPEPAAADNGLALGCAYYGWLELLQGNKVQHDGSTCFGKTYTNEEVLKAIQNYPVSFTYHPIDDDYTVITKLIESGKTVGWFQHGAEFGPRALGRRSILANPTIAEIGKHINNNIKFREDFRPFAPAVLKEDAHLYFEYAYESPYMIMVDKVKQASKDILAATTHVDGSARVQTVTEDWNPRFYNLLIAMKRQTGHGVLLNTSFNKKGQPIVETPEQALALFNETAMDVLVIENYLILKPD